MRRLLHRYVPKEGSDGLHFYWFFCPSRSGFTQGISGSSLVAAEASSFIIRHGGKGEIRSFISSEIKGVYVWLRCYCIL
jgi:hypothetical protein